MNVSRAIGVLEAAQNPVGTGRVLKRARANYSRMFQMVFKCSRLF